MLSRDWINLKETSLSIYMLMTSKLKAGKLGIHMLLTNKLKSNQLKWLLIRIILMLFEELYKFTGLAVYFSNLPEHLSRVGNRNKG